MKGSISKRIGKRGDVTWTGVIDVPVDPVTGKRRQKRLSAPTRRALETLVTRALHAGQTGAYLEVSTATLGEYLAQWLTSVEPTIRPSSYLRYRDAVTRQIVPALGAMPLAKLSGLHLQGFYAGRLAAGLAPATVALYHGVLHRALDQAVKWRLITDNPCDRVDVPRPNPPEMLTWTVAQVRAFLAGTAEHELTALWRLALVTGMRKGELLALRWADLDLERRTLAVRRTLSRGKDGLGVGEPKSAAGRRAIALPASCIAALKRHRVRQSARRLAYGDPWTDTDLVFDRGDGRLLHPNVVYATFQRLAGVLGLPRIRFHDLRHTAATLLLAEGVHPKIVQERLGHSDVSMTLNRYSHVTIDMQREAADRLDAALGGM